MKQLLFTLSFLMLTTLSSAQELPEFVPGEVLVRFTAEAYVDFTYESPDYPSVITSNEAITELFSLLEVYEIERLHPLEEHTQFGDSTGMNREFVLSFPPETYVPDVIKVLEEHPTVEHAAPNHLFFASITPNDEYYGNQWSLPKISMPDAWEIQQGGTDVRIAVLDIGFKPDHPDLSNKFSGVYRRDEVHINWRNYPDYEPIPGEDYTIPDDDPTGTGTHGTHVAGIAGAATNDSIGVAGVGWNNTIVPVRCGFMIENRFSGLSLVCSNGTIGFARSIGLGTTPRREW